MDFKSVYEKLYQHWLNEFRQIELTPLTKENYNNYQEASDFIKNYKLNQQDNIKNNIIDSFKNNFNFLFNDFSEIRKIKLINAALALQEIDLNCLLEAEKLFYQNLVSTIKGFDKVKVIESVERAESSKIKEVLDIIQEDVAQPDKNKINESLSEDLHIKKEVKDLNYTLVKFLQKAPPLVGIDLVNYGPFEKEDIANLPYKNAKILLTEKIAELIEHT